MQTTACSILGRCMAGELPKMGPAVWLEKYQMFALTRYDAVSTALREWRLSRPPSAS
jgi:hypothetical protein